MRAAHYLNQFFAGVGGEEADHPPVRIEGAVGPGRVLGLPVEYTLACGDDFFGEQEEVGADIREVNFLTHSILLGEPGGGDSALQ